MVPLPRRQIHNPREPAQRRTSRPASIKKFSAVAPSSWSIAARMSAQCRRHPPDRTTRRSGPWGTVSRAWRGPTGSRTSVRWDNGSSRRPGLVISLLFTKRSEHWRRSSANRTAQPEPADWGGISEEHDGHEHSHHRRLSRRTGPVAQHPPQRRLRSPAADRHGKGRPSAFGSGKKRKGGEHRRSGLDG